MFCRKYWWRIFLAFREKRVEEMFDEIYVRQNAGIGMAKAVDH